MIRKTRHLTEEEIALFLEKRCDDLEKKGVVDHLQTCKKCYADYEFSARARDVWGGELPSSDPARGLVGDGMRIATKTTRRSRGAPGRPRGRDFYLAGVFVTLAVVIAGVAWLAVPRGSDLDPRITLPIQNALEAVSNRAIIVIPGAEDAIQANPHTYRSRFFPHDDEVSASLLSLAKASNDNASRDVTYWLTAGFLVTGQLTVAQDLAEKAYRDYPDDAAIGTLSGVIAYCVGDNDLAERRLRAVLGRSPGDGVARLNLAIVLTQQGKEHEARLELEQVRALFPGTALAGRAGSVLSQ